jgi:hypothetical protein
MSDLTFTEKQKFEQIFGMASGYVLNFTNRTFEEFIQESTGRNIFDSRYAAATGSKAHRLRMFWQKEDNKLVGKLLGEMLDYLGETSSRTEMCRLIVARLLGHQIHQPQQDQAVSQIALPKGLAILKEEFDRLAAEKDRNKAGSAFEGFLNRLFEIFQFRPRQPYRIVGEQIDGAFELDGHNYLVEAKWVNHPLPEADLLVFRGKIEGKSTFTRGVFVALNGISLQARMAITQGKAPSFFVIDGHDIVMILSEAISLPDLLRRRVRLLAEEGRVCVPFSELKL